jgi:hypothetical protein
MTLEVFLDWINFILNDKGLPPTTVNIRVRTMRAFLLWCYLENLIEPEDFGDFLTYDGREMVSNTWRTRLHEVAHLAGIKKAIRPR